MPEVLAAIVDRIPPPTGEPAGPPRALIFDSEFDQYRGVVAYLRMVDGSFERGEEVVAMQARTEAELDELESFGYNLVIYPTASTYVTTKAMIDLWEGLKRDGTTITQLDKMVPFAQFNELMGLQKIRDIEHTYASSTGR